ncbi:MAG: hypothetical protein II776_07740 [Clostridia bacterium]|nr:hypothetical protein [Clostridia bacterium]
MKKLFLDLGEGTSLPTRQIVLILNAETATRQPATKRFLRRLSDRAEVKASRRPLRQVNALVLTNTRGKDMLYPSFRQAESLAADDR